MKLQTKFRFADRYGGPDTVVMVATYPGRKNRSIKNIDAVAWYAEHVGTALHQELSQNAKKLIILAQKTSRMEEWYDERGILICRVWEKGSPSAFLHILSTLLYFPKARPVIVQFEFHQFGGNLTTICFPLFLFGLKALGKKVTTIMHQAVINITRLSGHVNIRIHTAKAALVNVGLSLFFRLVGKAADTLIVHNNEIKHRVSMLSGRKDIHVVPLGFPPKARLYNRERARKLLGYRKQDIVIMAYGFLTWYKGTDWIVDQFASRRTGRYKLLLAGGPSPNIKDMAAYQRFLQKLLGKARQAPNIRVTGFIEDQHLPRHFAAADIVVFPYRALMSASGALATAVVHGKPILLSKTLATAYQKDEDFRNALTSSSLRIHDISFSLSYKNMDSAVRNILKKREAYQTFLTVLYENRRVDKIAQCMYQVIAAQAHTELLTQPAVSPPVAAGRVAFG